MMKFVLLFSFFAGACLWAQDATVPEPVGPPAPEAPVLADDGVRVSILGYHDLSEHLPETAMRLRTSKFRKQMETIHQLGLKVITLDDFSAWKKGEREIPAQSIVLTFDDGWKSVYTDAFPIL
jgi:hypothetical protein